MFLIQSAPLLRKSHGPCGIAPSDCFLQGAHIEVTMIGRNMLKISWSIECLEQAQEIFAHDAVDPCQHFTPDKAVIANEMVIEPLIEARLA
jgi:hypothetical protein